MNEIIKEMFTPFGKVSSRIFSIMTIAQVVIVILLLQFFHSPVIPAPTEILGAGIDMIKSGEFLENFMDSFSLVIKAMGIAIIMTMLIVYISRIPFFKFFALFVTKCRYLTLVGLAYLFTMFTDNVSGVKFYLLLFGIIPFFTTSFLSIVDSIDPQQFDKSYINKNNRWETLYEIVIIGRLDQLFEVMRQNFSIAWMMLTTVEGRDMAGGGIGTMLIQSNKHQDLAPIFALLIIVLSIGMLFDYGLGKARILCFDYIKKQ